MKQSGDTIGQPFPVGWRDTSIQVQVRIWGSVVSVNLTPFHWGLSYSNWPMLARILQIGPIGIFWS